MNPTFTSVRPVAHFQSSPPCSLLPSCLSAAGEGLPVLSAVAVFLFLLLLRSVGTLTLVLDHLGLEKAPVGVFFHQGVDHLLSSVETGRAGVLNVLLGFFSGHGVQVHLKVAKNQEFEVRQGLYLGNNTTTTI